MISLGRFRDERLVHHVLRPVAPHAAHRVRLLEAAHPEARVPQQPARHEARGPCAERRRRACPLLLLPRRRRRLHCSASSSLLSVVVWSGFCSRLLGGRGWVDRVGDASGARTRGLVRPNESHGSPCDPMRRRNDEETKPAVESKALVLAALACRFSRRTRLSPSPSSCRCRGSSGLGPARRVGDDLSNRPRRTGSAIQQRSILVGSLACFVRAGIGLVSQSSMGPNAVRAVSISLDPRPTPRLRFATAGSSRRPPPQKRRTTRTDQASQPAPFLLCTFVQAPPPPPHASTHHRTSMLLPEWRGGPGGGRWMARSALLCKGRPYRHRLSNESTHGRLLAATLLGGARRPRIQQPGRHQQLKARPSIALGRLLEAAAVAAPAGGFVMPAPLDRSPPAAHQHHHHTTCCFLPPLALTPGPTTNTRIHTGGSRAPPGETQQPSGGTW